MIQAGWGEVKKYGRIFRNGVFYVVCDKLNQIVKKCCFVVSLLVALSFLKNDEKCEKMKRAPHKGCDELYTPDEIRLVYQKAGISCGAVKTEDLSFFYSNFLAEQGVDLIVYSDNYDNIFDSRTDSEGNLIKLTNEVVCLWLNNHYDVILSMKKFNRLNNFCVKCMSHYKLFEHEDSHVCCTKLTCHKCFRQSNCSRNMNGDKFQCDNCKILFYDQDCFFAHMSNRVFKPIQSNYNRLTPCQYLFFCDICDKICPRFIFFTKSNAINHIVTIAKHTKKIHYCYETRNNKK